MRARIAWPPSDAEWFSFFDRRQSSNRLSPERMAEPPLLFGRRYGGHHIAAVMS